MCGDSEVGRAPYPAEEQRGQQSVEGWVQGRWRRRDSWSVVREEQLELFRAGERP